MPADKITQILKADQADGLTRQWIGEFKDQVALTRLIQQHWPQSLLMTAAKQYAQQLTDQPYDYCPVNSPYLSNLEVDHGQLYFDWHHQTVFNHLCQVLYLDPQFDTALIGFQNALAPRIDALIDLATSTIGTFNNQTNVYSPQGKLSALTIGWLTKAAQQYQKLTGPPQTRSIQRQTLDSPQI